jgi:hypothetical protein
MRDGPAPRFAAAASRPSRHPGSPSRRRPWRAIAQRPARRPPSVGDRGATGGTPGSPMPVGSAGEADDGDLDGGPQPRGHLTLPDSPTSDDDGPLSMVISRRDTCHGFGIDQYRPRRGPSPAQLIEPIGRRGQASGSLDRSEQEIGVATLAGANSLRIRPARRRARRQRSWSARLVTPCSLSRGLMITVTILSVAP